MDSEVAELEEHVLYEWLEEVDQVMSWMEEVLEGKVFFGGEKIVKADFVVFEWICRVAYRNQNEWSKQVEQLIESH